MGAMVYRGAIFLKDWAERNKLDPLIRLGKAVAALASLFGRTGGLYKIS